jgi:hypothetical protein
MHFDQSPDRLAHSVCFRCRKAWAPPVVCSRWGMLKAIPDNRPCPDCGGPLIGLGLAFKPPKQDARRAWRKLEAAALAGNRFRKP